MNWLIESIETTMGASGIRQQVRFEGA